MLRHRIARSFETVTERVRITDDFSLPFTRVADPDKVLDDVADAVDLRQRLAGRADSDQDLHLPYWAELWDSAVGMGAWLVKTRLEDPTWKVAEIDPSHRPLPPSSVLHPPFSPSATAPASSPSAAALDLGCGMGLAGTVAAAMGWRVTFADLEPAALLFARLNSLPYAGNVDELRRLNWQTGRLARRFDLVLGADILYERAQWPYLEPFWRAHLAPGGRILLGEPGRQTGDLFTDWIATKGWSLIRHEQPAGSKRIRLFELRAVGG